MKSYDFDAVGYDGAVYCTECLPDTINPNNEEVSPIFADSEWDYYPTCDVCQFQHTYMTLTEDGRKQNAFNNAPVNLQDTMKDHSGIIALHAHAFPGGYPVAYLTADMDTLCANCAQEALEEATATTNYGLPTNYFIVEDNPNDLLCDNCNNIIAAQDEYYRDLENTPQQPELPLTY